MYMKFIFPFLTGVLLPLTICSVFAEGSVSDNGNEPGPTRFEPQVAFACQAGRQYYAQFMAESGEWVSNRGAKVTCVEDKMEILKFCKQSYPNREITNIVESSKLVKVPNFCQVDRNKCRNSIYVKPYRCLEGSFQSDALLVPEGCLFDHIHNQTRCMEFADWNTTALQACQARGLSLKAFAMLLPCGIDVFSGVEFVCCPVHYNNRGPSHHAMDVEEPLALPQVEHKVPESTTASPPEESGSRDEYYSRFDPQDEHEAFQKALRRNQARHREHISKVMKEWSELEERYQELHKSNPKSAEEFKRSMTQRFQQTVQAVEAENEAEKQQLITLHQQRIVAHVNEMKREAMSCYSKALNEPELNTHRVQKCLQKLLRALNKDRHHTVAHFKHLLNSDYEAADRDKDSTVQHLADLDRMVNQSLNMLARKPELFAKIGRQMRNYATALRSKDVTPVELTPSFDDDESDEEDEDEYDDEEDDVTDEDDDDDVIGDDDDDDLANDDEDDSDEIEEIRHVSTATEGAESIPIPSVPEPVSSSSSHGSPQPDDEPSRPTEGGQQGHMDEPLVAHARRHSFEQNQPGFHVTSRVTEAESRGVYFTLAFAGVALTVAMVVGIVVLRRRNHSHPHSQGFIEVNQTVSPEERHVNSMQVNGYENPTYKYFEINKP